MTRAGPSLKQYQAPQPTDTALALEAALRERMPERTLLGVLARTAHWLEWHRRFAPASGSDLSATARRHVTVEKLNKAIADVVNAFMELDLIRVWSDGSVVAADGTQVDTFIDNLLAETSIRYGGTGSGTTTSPTPTSRCSSGSSRSGCGRRCT